ncbi:MAG TPA: hypothetical protein VM326_05135, partial [Sphingomicrobium sp.]|nr:hypothetical protein [Sphingomicrobium sp.]
MTLRLINRTDVLKQLLAAVAAVPVGERLHIPALRDALVSQGDVISGLEMLIAAGELDPRTLRPPVKAAVAMPRAERSQPGAALLAEIEAFCGRSGMAVSRFGKAVVNDFSLVNRLRKGARVTEATIARAREYIAGAAHGGELPEAPAPQAAEPEAPPKPKPEASETIPPPASTSERAEARPQGAGRSPAKSEGTPVAQPPSSPAPLPTGNELADAIEAYAKEH